MFNWFSKNKNDNIIMKGLEIYHPKKQVDNSYFLDYFKSLGFEDEKIESAKEFMETLGREQRYIADEDDEDNTLSMAVKASKNLIEEENMSTEDIDMIKVATDTPEYLAPSNALLLNHRLGASANHVNDLNSNCIGLLSAFDETARYMKQNPNYDKSLLVGSTYLTSITRDDCFMTYPVFGDGACAIMLEKTKEKYKRGFIDSIHYSNTVEHDVFKYPNTGFSDILNNDNHSEKEKKLRFTPAENDFPGDWSRLSKKVLERNNLSPEDVDHWIFSQFSKPMVYETLDRLQASYDKTTYVGDEYGYTGVTSPFLALYEAMNQNKVEEGDNIILSSVGGGYVMSVILYRL